MAKRAYIFEAIESFDETITVGWVHATTGTTAGETSIIVHRDKGERFVIRGIEQRKVFDADKRYRRIDN